MTIQPDKRELVPEACVQCSAHQQEIRCELPAGHRGPHRARKEDGPFMLDYQWNGKTMTAKPDKRLPMTARGYATEIMELMRRAGVDVPLMADATGTTMQDLLTDLMETAMFQAERGITWRDITYDETQKND